MSIVYFETVSGSAYELDEANRRIRRLRGAHAPRARQGADGEWREYRVVSPVHVGEPVFIFWPKDTTPLLPGSPDEAEPGTITSTVTRAGSP